MQSLASPINSTLSMMSDTAPVGAVLAFAGVTAPSGWLICDGSAISREIYASLFLAIGTTWGSGNGSTTFNIPDARGAALAGAGTSVGYTQNETITLGVKHNDQSQGHVHKPNGDGINQNHAFAPNGTTSFTATTGAVATVDNALTGVPRSDGSNGTPRTGSTTRGKVVGVNYIIKAIEAYQTFFTNPYANVLSGSGIPTMTPSFIGQQYIDIPTGSIYAASGTGGAYNWALLGVGGTSEFTKDSVANMVYWADFNDPNFLVYDTGTKRVSTIINKQGSTIYNITQSNDSYRGSYIANAVNGKGVLRLDAATRFYEADVTNIAQPGTVFYVFANHMPQGGYMAVWGTATSYSLIDYNVTGYDAGKVCMESGTRIVIGSYVQGGRNMVSMVHNGASSWGQVNNNAVVAGNIGTGDFLNTLNIGRPWTVGNYFNGDICEIIAYNRVLTAAEITKVQAYLNNKWGVY